MSTEYTIHRSEDFVAELCESSSRLRLHLSGGLAVYQDDEPYVYSPPMTGEECVALALEVLKAASYVIGEDRVPAAVDAALAGKADSGYYRSLLSAIVEADPERPPAPSSPERTPTNDQIAGVMLLVGSPAQVAEAIGYCRTAEAPPPTTFPGPGGRLRWLTGRGLGRSSVLRGYDLFGREYARLDYDANDPSHEAALTEFRERRDAAYEAQLRLVLGV